MGERKWYNFWRATAEEKPNLARIGKKKEGFRAVAGIPDLVRDTEG